VRAGRDLRLGNLQSAFATGGVLLDNLGRDSSLSLQAVSGDLSVSGSAETDAYGSTYESVFNLVPTRLSLQAPNGGIKLSAGADGGVVWTSQPGTGGSFEALAGGNLSLYALQFNAGRTDTTPQLQVLPEDIARALALGDLRRADGSQLDPSSREPIKLVAATGDVELGLLNSARPVEITAGRDILFERGLQSSFQHQDATELSLLQAGRDILFKQGSLVIEGPGDLLLTAGRDIDLGAGFVNQVGIVSAGNGNNTLLPAGQGASVTLIAGLRADGADYSRAVLQGAALLGVNSLIDAAGPLYALLSGAADSGAAARAFDALPVAARIDKLRSLMGSEACNSALADYVRSLPGQAGLSDAAAVQALARMTEARQQAAAGVILAGLFGYRDAETRLAFINQQVQASAEGRARLAELRAWLATRTGQVVADGQAQTVFESLPLARQILWLNHVLVGEVRSAGRTAAALTAGADQQAAYDRGLRAIDAVFPADRSSDLGQGDVRLSAAQIKTLQGGDINLMVPGGSVNAGQLSATGNTNNLGIVTVAGGDISAISSGDFTVNQSRVFTLAEGNILLWSSTGSIDAGRGAKTVTGTPAPVLRLDSQTGRLYLDTSGSFTGSGIAVLDARSDLDLYAPAGAIDAGEAGIKAKGNVFLGAEVVRNAVEINASGNVTGVQLGAVTVGVTAGLANAANASAAANRPADDDEDERRKRRRARRNLLLEFLGYGRV
jgi:hypothetical protein